MLAKFLIGVWSVATNGRHPSRGAGLISWFTPLNQKIRQGAPKSKKIKIENSASLFRGVVLEFQSLILKLSLKGFVLRENFVTQRELR